MFYSKSTIQSLQIWITSDFLLHNIRITVALFRNRLKVKVICSYGNVRVVTIDKHKSYFTYNVFSTVLTYM